MDIKSLYTATSKSNHRFGEIKTVKFLVDTRQKDISHFIIYSKEKIKKQGPNAWTIPWIKIKVPKEAKLQPNLFMLEMRMKFVISVLIFVKLMRNI